MNNYLPIISVLGIVATTTIHSQPALALNRAEIAEITKEFTVQIEGKREAGTGTIVERNNNIYTVLTCNHVVDAGSDFEITTADGKKHQVIVLKNLKDIDLAIVQFRSKQNYEVADLGDSGDIVTGTNSYVVGYPDPIPGIPERAYLFQNASIVSNLETGENGYQIIHKTPTTDASSGGGLFDEDGYLVGVNGRTTSDAQGRAYYGLAIPLEIYLENKNRFTTPRSFTPPPNAVTRGNTKLKQEDYRSAIIQFNQALDLNEEDLAAIWGRGKAYYGLKDFATAIKDFDRILKHDRNDAIKFFYRGSTRAELKQPHKAIADYTQAIRLNPDYLDAYINRAQEYWSLGKYVQAISNYNQIIWLDANSVDAYISRAEAYSNLEEYERAIADYTEAIRLQPNSDKAYHNRGITHKMLGNKDRAIEDFRQAANIYRQQGNMKWYNYMISLIEKLE